MTSQADAVSARRSWGRRLAISPLVALTVAPIGYNLAMPGADSGASWAVAYEVIHGVFIHNILTLGWLCAAIVVLPVRPLRVAVSARAWQYAGLIALLGVLGLVSTLSNSQTYSSWADIGEVARMMLLSFYFLLVYWLAVRYGPGFVLRWFLLGLAVGGVVNIYLSVTRPYYFAGGTLPALYSRNGGGGILALGVSLSAWAWLVVGTNARLDRSIAAFAGLVGAVGAAMSFSKTAMLVGAVGAIIWAVIVLAPALMRRRMTHLIAILVSGLTAVSLATWWPPLNEFVTSVQESVQIKFYAVLDLEQNHSVANRLYYYQAVGEIMSKSPVFGVGYSGFLPTVMQTEAYKIDWWTEEDPLGGKRANPHNSFLYYAAANGIPGVIVTLALYALFVGAIWRSLHEPSLIAWVTTGGLALSYLLYAQALPSLYKTEVMYLPAAVAAAGRMRSDLEHRRLPCTSS